MNLSRLPPHLVLREPVRARSRRVAVGRRRGLGPSDVGDEFTFVHDDDTGTDESLSLRVLALAGFDLLVAGGGGELIRPGDMLLAEITD